MVQQPLVEACEVKVRLCLLKLDGWAADCTEVGGPLVEPAPFLAKPFANLSSSPVQILGLVEAAVACWHGRCQPLPVHSRTAAVSATKHLTLQSPICLVALVAYQAYRRLVESYLMGLYPRAAMLVCEGLDQSLALRAQYLDYLQEY